MGRFRIHQNMFYLVKYFIWPLKAPIIAVGGLTLTKLGRCQTTRMFLGSSWDLNCIKSSPLVTSLRLILHPVCEDAHVCRLRRRSAPMPRRTGCDGLAFSACGQVVSTYEWRINPPCRDICLGVQKHWNPRCLLNPAQPPASGVLITQLFTNSNPTSFHHQ